MEDVAALVRILDRAAGSRIDPASIAKDIKQWVADADEAIAEALDRAHHDCGKGDYCPQYGDPDVIGYVGPRYAVMDVANGSGEVVATIDLDDEIDARRAATCSNQWGSILA